MSTSPTPYVCDDERQVCYHSGRKEAHKLERCCQALGLKRHSAGRRDSLSQCGQRWPKTGYRGDSIAIGWFITCRAFRKDNKAFPFNKTSEKGIANGLPVSYIKDLRTDGPDIATVLQQLFLSFKNDRVREEQVSFKLTLAAL